MTATRKHLAFLFFSAALAGAPVRAELPAASTVFSFNPPKGASLLQHSHIPIWFDQPDDHRKYDVDVIIQDMDINDEAEVPGWKARIDRWHAQGKIFFAELRAATPLGRSFEVAMDDPGLQEAVCLDFNLQPITPRWQVGRSYKGKPLYLYCTNHPRFRAYLRHRVYMFMAAGADGIQVDEGAGAMFCAFKREPGCYCEYCQAGFRDYLREKYSPAELQVLGVPDLATFDYRQLVLRHVTDRTTYDEAAQKGTIPLIADFKDFLLRSDVALFRSLQDMASRLAGRHVPMSWDNVNVSTNYEPYYPFLDVFAPETHHALFGDGPRDDLRLSPGIIHGDKLADALGKWHTLTPLPGSWTIMKAKGLTGILRLWTAVSYAHGGIPRYPRKGWCTVAADGQVDWYYPPQGELEPLYDFVRTHRALFDGYESIGQVGVVVAERPGQPDQALLHLAVSLGRLNIPFAYLVAGGRNLPQRLQPGDAKKFSAVLVPGAARPDAAQQAVIDGWLEQGTALTATANDDVAALLAGRIEPLVGLESVHDVRLTPRANPARPDTPVVCHLVNWNYDPATNRAEPQKDVRVRLHTALTGGAKVTQVTYLTVGRPAQSLAFTVRDNAVRVTVPEVALWGIVQIAHE